MVAKSRLSVRLAAARLAMVNAAEMAPPAAMMRTKILIHSMSPSGPEPSMVRATSRNSTGPIVRTASATATASAFEAR